MTERDNAKRLTRRRLLLGSAAATGLALLAACGGSPTATTAPAARATTAPAGGASTAPASGAAASSPAASAGASSAAQPGQTKVVFWSSWGGKNGEALTKLVNDYNASQKEIFVDNQFQGTYDETAQKLAAGIAARQVPDMVSLSEVTWNKFSINKTLQALDDLIKTANLDPKDFVESLINEGTRQGKIWWLPFARSTPLFYYNRTLFKEAGLEDRAPKTWDELRTWGLAIQKLNKPDLTAFAFTTGKNFNAWYFQGNVWQWGGNYSDKNLNITIDQPAAVEAGEWLRKFVHEDKLGFMAPDQSLAFTNGLCAMTLQSTGALGGILTTAKFDVGTGMLPEQKKFGCPTGGAGLALLAAAPDKNKQAAIGFIKFLLKPENVAYWSKQTGYMPATKSAREAAEMQQLFTANPNYKVAVDQLPKTQPQDTARLFVPNGDQTIGTGLEKIIVNNEPAATAFKGVADQLNRDAADIKDQIKDLGL
jgi:sn-glycerol 3-phosphate transport system substrate-binding protein